jgi:hypothetical protein
LLAFLLPGCGDDDNESEAQRHGVGSACLVDADCTEAGQTCLAFKGGYCGVADCTTSCPEGSACVTHDDGKNYCFLVCTDKPQCNLHRLPEVEANCSSSVTFVDSALTVKACVPPSG